MPPAQFRTLALAMPDSEEKSHFGQPDFRVRGKIFAGLDPEGTRGTLKLPPELQFELDTDLEPGRYQASTTVLKRGGERLSTYVDLGRSRSTRMRSSASRSTFPTTLSSE